MVRRCSEFIECPDAGWFMAEWCLSRTSNPGGACTRRVCQIGNEVRAWHNLLPITQEYVDRVKAAYPHRPRQKVPVKSCTHCGKHVKDMARVTHNAFVAKPRARICSSCFMVFCVEQLTKRLPLARGHKKQIYLLEISRLQGRIKAVQGRADARGRKRDLQDGQSQGPETGTSGD